MPGPLLTPSNSASLWLLHQPQSAAAFPCFISQDVPGAAAKLLAGEERAGSASVPFRAVFPYFELFGIIPVPGAAAEPSRQRVPPPALDAGNIPPSLQGISAPSPLRLPQQLQRCRRYRAGSGVRALLPPAPSLPHGIPKGCSGAKGICIPSPARRDRGSSIPGASLPARMIPAGERGMGHSFPPFND